MCTRSRAVNNFLFCVLFGDIYSMVCVLLRKCCMRSPVKECQQSSVHDVTKRMNGGVKEGGGRMKLLQYRYCTPLHMGWGSTFHSRDGWMVHAPFVRPHGVKFWSSTVVRTVPYLWFVVIVRIMMYSMVIVWRRSKNLYQHFGTWHSHSHLNSTVRDFLRNGPLRITCT